MLWEISVITVIRGATVFVASNLPPRPTSITARSGFVFGQIIEGDRCRKLEENVVRFGS